MRTIFNHNGGKAMTNLTEQWKKGELPEGHYYIKTRSETNIDEYIQWYKDHGIPSEKSFAYFNVQQVLAPVPSYEEWQASEKYIKHLEEKIKIYERKDKQATETSIAYNKLAEENEELKEILERHKKATAKAQIRSCDLEIINEQLKEQINKCYLDAINRGTANTVKAVKEFGMPERIEELVKQNDKLKELLEECSPYIGHSAASRTIKNSAGHKKDMKLLTKIDEALR